ncbi:hypothetical protein GF337_06745 [candidate division KSB1 bacterium]|nr:hypothetical protein [candidate division KSB1 bacterium]
MKDLMIKGSQIELELKYILGCLAAAITLNIYAIISYQTKWIEMLTQLHVTLALAIVFYILVLCIRLIAVGAKRLSKKGN